VRVHSPRKRAGVSSIPPVEADAPNVVWAIDFQFDSTIDGRAIKIAPMIDEHTRRSLLHVVERSITAERLVIELEDAFAAAGGPPKVLQMNKWPRVGFSSAAAVLRKEGRTLLHSGRLVRFSTGVNTCGLSPACPLPSSSALRHIRGLVPGHGSASLDRAPSLYV
jgi:hypothetical protein